MGALRLTEYKARDNLDWEGGNTHVWRTTLCVRGTRRCLEDRSLSIDPLWQVLAPRISADGSTVAWYTCGATCVLHAHEVATGRTRHDDTQCPINDYLEFAWEGNVPKAQYYWGGGIGYARDTLCRNARGEIALPIGTPP